jgi:glycosyltransferase involved in cell wall biosynthesis
MDLNLTPETKTLSIIIPVYNEAQTIAQVINAVSNIQLLDNIKTEIIVVNDGSTDQTSKVLESQSNIKLISHSKNQGKGAAVKTGILASTGDYIIIQDADLEYDPDNIQDMLNLLISQNMDAINGSRYIGKLNRKFVYYQNQFANIIFTLISNLLTGYRLTDICSCYKLIEGKLARTIASETQSTGFGIEAELIARLAKHKAKVIEIPISYQGRSKKEGKHLKAKDGIVILYTVLKYNILN